MKRQNIILVSLFLICLISCDKNGGISFGTAEYYPSFLWVDENSTPVTKTFDFEFSEDAQNDHSCFAEFQFVDQDGKPISTAVMQVSIDGGKIKNNRFRINSDVKSKEISFMFSPKAETGKHEGYLKLVGHNLERLDEQPLTPNQQVDAFKWTLNYNKVMNPLAKVLMFIGLGLLALLFLWFALVRWMVYDYIKVGSMRIVEPYYSSRRIKGARQVILTNRRTKQGWLNRLFTGKIIYEINSVWTNPVVFEPTSKGEVKMKSSDKYTIDPFDFKLQKGEEYTLRNEETKERMKLTIY